MTKKESLLHALEGRGEEGLHSFEAIKHGGWRYAARIHDLKQDGFKIESIPQKWGDAMGCRYFLRERT